MALAPGAAPARAGAAGPPADAAVESEDAVASARQLLAAGKPAKALALLEAHLSKAPGDAYARFLVGEIYFHHGHERQAALEYRLALAGPLDAASAAEARARLQDISLPKAWRYSLGATLSANSVVDGGSDDGRTPLSGLSASPYDGIEKHSAITATVSARADKITDLSDGLALHTTILAAASTGAAKDYDTESVSLQSGPEWTLGGLSHVSLSPRAITEWVAGKSALNGGGLALNGDTYGGDTLWAGQVSADSFDIRYNGLGRKTNLRLAAKRTRYLGPSALWSVDGLVARTGASLVSGPYTDGQVRIGRLLQAPLSALVYVEATGRVRTFETDALTGDINRTDRFAQLSLRFSKRDVMIYSGIPFVTLSAARNQSTMAAYRYSRLRLDFGLTRGF